MKREYIAPQIKVIKVEYENVMAPGLGISSHPSNSSGDAKGGYLDEEDEEDEINPNLWGEPLF